MRVSQTINREGAGASAGPRPLVHLELHTPNRSSASDFYTRLLEWRVAAIDSEHGCYAALDLGCGGRDISGGVVECGIGRPMWLPYVDVDRIDVATERAVRLGASVMLGPREGPAGWRTVVSTPTAGQLVLWQPKEWR